MRLERMCGSGDTGSASVSSSDAVGGQLADPAAVGEQARAPRPPTVSRIENSTITSCICQPRSVPIWSKNSTQNSTQVTSLATIRPTCTQNEWRLASAVGERRAQGGGDGAHPPVTCSRRSPAANTAAAIAVSTASQRHLPHQQQRIGMAGGDPPGHVGHGRERQRQADQLQRRAAAGRAGSACRRAGTPASGRRTTTTWRRSARRRRRRRRAGRRCWRRSRAAPPAPPAPAPAATAAAPRTARSAARRRRRRTISRAQASPSSSDMRMPTTDTGRSICTATAPLPISSPISSTERGRTPSTATWAANTYQSSGGAGVALDRAAVGWRRRRSRAPTSPAG